MKEGAHLSPHDEREDLFRMLIAAQGFEPQADRPILRRGEPVAPLASTQRSLWFLDRMQPGNTAYNGMVARRVLGRLDPGALQRALTEVVRRHESLRTTFSMQGDEPIQVVQPPSQVPVPCLDLGGLPRDRQDAELARWIDAEATRPFDLEAGPLFRAALARLDDEHHALVLGIHHILFDGWSAGILLRELNAHYSAFAEGKPAPLPELPVQYGDYAAWQREQLDGGYFHEQLAYWRQQLDGVQPFLDLPADHPRPPVQSFRGAEEILHLDRALTDALREVGRQQRASLYMVLLAAFQVLLHRYSGQDEISIGSPVAARGRPEIEPLIGFVANTIVLRNDLGGNPTFNELLARTRRLVLDALSNQDLPFDTLVADLKPDRSLGRNPLFQAMLALQNLPQQAARLGDLRLERLHSPVRTSKFDLSLTVEEDETGLRAALEYALDLFEPATARRMAGHLRILLEAVASNPETQIGRLPLLPAAEVAELDRWNATDRPYRRDTTVPQVFEEWVARTPAAVAAVDEVEQLTYAELNERANRIAHRLRRLGLKPEGLVGLCGERCAQMAVAILGVLKAGGAYVPLDPTYPAERIAWMLSDSKPEAVLTTVSCRGMLSGYDGPLLLLDDLAAFADEPIGNPEPMATARNLAYVIYTSGSTGRPKGVTIEHGGLLNHGAATRELIGLEPRDRMLQVAPLSFDVSAEEMFPAWLAGAAVVFGPSLKSTSFAELVSFMARHRVTVANLPPAFWHEWVDDLEAKGAFPPDTLRVLLVGGEAPSRAKLRAWLRAVGERVSWINSYGPTEATISVSAYKATVADQTGAAPIPIGRPMGNTELLVLDRYLQRLPVGVPGELYVGGAGLARGYLNQPGLTAERFVSHPFRPGQRLYRTGDRARYLPDGNLEFLGRVDHQIKLRGFRIEPGEIEAALTGHPAIREVLVLLRGAHAGTEQLVAYATAHASPVPDDEMRVFARARLPDHMVPDAFVWLDAFPLGSSGKVDRAALPAPSQGESVPRDTTPRTPTEAKLSAIWCAALGVDNPGRDESFFALGGHSLLAARVVSRVRQELGVEVPLRTLFEAPSIATFAAEVDRLCATQPASPFGAITRLARQSQRVVVSAHGDLELTRG